jgi:type I restriction enzyme S subunit
MSFRQYFEYKYSGIEWLGEIPSDWICSPIKYFYEIVGGTTPQSDVEAYWNGSIIWVTPADLSKISKFEIKSSERLITEEGFRSCGVKLVPAGSIVLSTRAPIGTLGIASKTLCTNQGCKSLIPHEGQNSRFLTYALSIAKEALNNRGRGTTFLELSADELASFRLPFPCEVTQNSIVNFLDSETTKIDNLIAEQEKLIELLKEKRQAVISNAVTKGLDPTVKMQNSRIEWLGDVPAAWTISKIKTLTSRISSGKTPSGGSEIYVDEGVMFLRSQNVHDDGLKLDEVVYIPVEIDQQMSNSRVQAGDVLLNITGASIGRSCSVPHEFPNANVNQHVCAIRFRNPQYAPFAEMFFKSFAIKSQTDFIQNGAAREGLNFEQIGAMSICIPSIEEQNKIVSFLQEKLSTFSNLIAQTHTSIELLKERRSSLICAAVSGQIDVRNVATSKKAT